MYGSRLVVLGERMTVDAGGVPSRVWRFFRNAVLVVFGLGVIAAIVFVLNAYLHQQEVNRVSVTLGDRGSCDNPEYPLFVSVSNGSSRVVDEVFFEFSARVPGYSSELVDFGYEKWDKIIKPGETMGACWAYRKLRPEMDADFEKSMGRPPKPVQDKAGLQWAVRRVTVFFAGD